MNSITQKLVEDGYKYHQGKTYQILKSTEHLYQKRFRDAEGNTKCFINAWYYPAQDIHGHHLDERLQFEAQLREGTYEQDEMFIDISPSTKDHKIAEEVIERAWQSLGMGFVELKDE